MLERRRSCGEREFCESHANAWLHALPDAKRNWKLNNKEMEILLRFQIGEMVGVGESKSCCKCQAHLDSQGYHAITCPKNYDMTARHNHLRDLIVKLLFEGKHGSVSKEPTHLFKDSNIRADVLSRTLRAGLHKIALDACVTSPMQPDIIHRAVEMTRATTTASSLAAPSQLSLERSARMPTPPSTRRSTRTSASSPLA